MVVVVEPTVVDVVVVLDVVADGLVVDVVAVVVLVLEELVVDGEVVVEVVVDDVVVVRSVVEVVVVVEWRVDDVVPVDVLTEVVEELVLEDVVLEVVPDVEPRSASIRPAWITPATKLPVTFAASTIWSVDPGAQRCALIRDARPNVTCCPPTKSVRSRAVAPDASSMSTLWPSATLPSTSTRAGESTSMVAFRDARRLQNS